MATVLPPLSPPPKTRASSPLPPLYTKRGNDGAHIRFPSMALAGATAGIALAAAAITPDAADAAGASLPLAVSALQEPANALSLPTWAIHVSSVVEWIAAMVLVWEYGERSGHTAWKGLTWGMVPLLGGALCACTWHFFYNSESLEILVALQGALTTIGNTTMLIAAFRIFKASQESSNSS